MKSMKSLRGKLFLWYGGSLIIITIFFYFAIHIFSFPYGNLIFLLILLTLAAVGFFIVQKMTNGLTRLSSKIKTINSKNLSERVVDVNHDDEIGELAYSFNQLLDRLDEAFKREKQFIADVAHELKTPLSVQRASLELTLTKDRSKEEYMNAVYEALTDSNKISSTLKNILDLAWSQADEVQKGKTKVSLSEIVSEIKEVASKLAFDKQLSVGGTIEEKIIVLGRKDRLFRAFLNVVDNAVKYSPKSGNLFIDLYTKNGVAVFQVKDTGSGIAQQDLPHVFERFYRGSKADKNFGSGLGLAIVQAIVKAHLGSINISSKVGKGTSVAISLPVVMSF